MKVLAGLAVQSIRSAAGQVLKQRTQRRTARAEGLASVALGATEKTVIALLSSLNEGLNDAEVFAISKTFRLPEFAELGRGIAVAIATGR
jgi:hypothetical protein